MDKIILETREEIQAYRVGRHILEAVDFWNVQEDNKDGFYTFQLTLKESMDINILNIDARVGQIGPSLSWGIRTGIPFCNHDPASRIIEFGYRS